MKKISRIFVLALLVAAAFASMAFADVADDIIARWTKKEYLVDKYDKVSNLEIKVTYYSAEYIEAYLQKEAKANLWTEQELEDYKAKMMSTLQLQEMVPVNIEFTNNGPSMHLGPFDIMVKLQVGNKQYQPVDYDKRFNFRFQGKKDGLIYFPRYDAKTGKDLFKGIKSVRLFFSPAISPITDGRSIDFVWDISRDDPSRLFRGKTAAKLETDRLLKRLDKLRRDRSEEESKLNSIDTEIKTIQTRIDELAGEL